MRKDLKKSIQDYLSKIKKPTPNIQFSSKKWIPKSCWHTKTHSLEIEGNQNDDNNDKDDAATLSDIDRFLFENFKSLYIKDDEEEHEKQKKLGAEEQDDHQPQTPSSGTTLFESPRFIDMPSDFCGSHRFFVSPTTTISDEIGLSSDSNSGSSSDSGSISISTNSDNLAEDKDVKIADDCIAVLKYSPNPHNDFRRSMQEMMEARLQQHGRVDWDFMVELLFCYLNLNHKKSYRFILSAFVDLTVIFRQKENKVPARSRSFRMRRRRRRSMRHVA